MVHVVPLLWQLFSTNIKLIDQNQCAVQCRMTMRPDKMARFDAFKQATMSQLSAVS